MPQTYFIASFAPNTHDAFPIFSAFNAESELPTKTRAAWRVDGVENAAHAISAVLMSAADQWLGESVTVTRLIPREPTADERLESARRVLRANYWQDVRNVVDDLRDNIERGHIADTDDAETWLHETVDGSQRVIYTAQAIEGLLYTDNESAFVDEFGEDGLVRDGDVHWSGLMYSAFLADIRAQIGDLEQFIADNRPHFADCAQCDERIATEADATPAVEGEPGDYWCADCAEFYATEREDASDYDPCDPKNGGCL